MDSIVGFTVLSGLPPERVNAALTAQSDVVRPFQRLNRTSVTIGWSRLELWGHGALEARVRRQEDGSLVVLVGSPHGRISWKDLPDGMAGCNSECDDELPWDGRVVLLAISPDGRDWTIRNDWVGSIPVFHAEVGGGRIASTIEPVVVRAAGFSPSDIFLPALVSILINGHGLSDWTLYRGMKVVPPDSVSSWSDRGFRTRRVWTVEPTEDLNEVPWNSLVDAMFESSRTAISTSLDTAPAWVLPLSAGLDSRLVAAVSAGRGADVRAYAWGSCDTVDVIYSREIARALALPWASVDLGTDYLVRYTPRWAAWFGSSLHFHGMYQMRFLDAIEGGPPGPIVSGFLGDTLACSRLYQHADPATCRLVDQWHIHWTPDEVKSLLMMPLDDAFDELSDAIDAEINSQPGSRFKQVILAEVWSRQRFFTSFQTTLAHYWRGVATPFLTRAYARFCLALPRPALEHKRLLADVYRRHYPSLAAIPGTYSAEPFVRTGRYLLKRRIAEALPPALRFGPLRGFRDCPPRMDIDSVQANGWKALWPLAETRKRLAEWLDVSKLDEAYAVVMASRQHMRPLRKLQSVQALAFRLLEH